MLYSNNKIKKNFFFQIITCGLLSATLCPERHVRWTTCVEAPALPRDRLQQFLLVSLFPRPSSGTGTSTAGPSALPRPGPVSPRPTPHAPQSSHQAAGSAERPQRRRRAAAAGLWRRPVAGSGSAGLGGSAPAVCLAHSPRHAVSPSGAQVFCPSVNLYFVITLFVQRGSAMSQEPGFAARALGILPTS